MHLPWTSAKPRLAYPPSRTAALPEPNFRLVSINSLNDVEQTRVQEEMHYEWHIENPHRPCEHGAQAPGHPPPPPKDRD